MVRLNEFYVGASVTGSVVSAAVAYYAISKRRQSTVFHRVGCVKKLFIYPIKACGGVEVGQLEVTKFGVKHGQFRDRSWVVIDDCGRTITLIEERKLVLIKVSFSGEETLRLENLNNSKDFVEVQLKTSLADTDKVTDLNVFGGKIKGVDCGHEVAQWLATRLDISGPRLVQFIEEFDPRPTRSKGKHGADFEKKYPIIYQNKSTVMMATTSSLDELNRKISSNSSSGEAVTIDHFRPNVFVDNAAPWDEDNWSNVTIGHSLQLDNVMSCNRCPQTTVSRTDASLSKEPMQTLRKFRLATNASDRKRLGNSPYFGTLFGTRFEGVISTGDEIFAIRS